MVIRSSSLPHPALYELELAFDSKSFLKFFGSSVSGGFAAARATSNATSPRKTEPVSARVSQPRQSRLVANSSSVSAECNSGASRTVTRESAAAPAATLGKRTDDVLDFSAL